MRRLILFDIDGTLLTTGGAAARAFRATLHEVFGSSGPTGGYSFAGKTDPQIARDLLRLAGIDDDAIDAGLPEVWERYPAALEREIQGTDPVVFPGVRELVERLDFHGDAILGLLTGNIRDGARIKLAAAGFDFDSFAIGAFGSDHAARTELPAVAVQRAEDRFGRRFEGKAVVIIGDTPMDVACGEHLGVRAIAVATGTYSEDELEACAPDFTFSSLADTNAVCEAIFS